MNIVITGGSKGIGLFLVKKYLEKANKIYIISRTKGIEDKKIEYINLDLSSLDEVLKISKYLSLKDIDLVILNAGVSLGHKKENSSFEDFYNLFKINFLSQVALLEYILPVMQKKGGKIVFISSLASIITMPTSIAYSTSKRAINSYAQGLRNLYNNIKIVNILPGFIDTDMTRKNNFFMPFLMDLDSGGEIIYKAIENNKTFFAFPKIFYYFIKFINILPIKIKDKIIRRIL